MLRKNVHKLLYCLCYSETCEETYYQWSSRSSKGFCAFQKYHRNNWLHFIGLRTPSDANIHYVYNDQYHAILCLSLFLDIYWWNHFQNRLGLYDWLFYWSLVPGSVQELKPSWRNYSIWGWRRRNLTNWKHQSIFRWFLVKTWENKKCYYQQRTIYLWIGGVDISCVVLRLCGCVYQVHEKNPLFGSDVLVWYHSKYHTICLLGDGVFDVLWVIP